MSIYDNLPEHVALPDEDFDAYFEFTKAHMPGVLDDEDANLEMPQEGFKKALRAAFTAGKLSVINQFNDATGV